MDSAELIGAVGARFLVEELDKALSQPDAGTARFLLDRLQDDQVIAIVRAVLADSVLARRVYIAVPQEIGSGRGLPAAVLTRERAVHFRNRPAPEGKSALLLVNTDDDQGVSLQDMTPLGAKTLTDRADLWVAIAGVGLPLSDLQREVWLAAMRGLLDAKDFSLSQVAAYVASVAARIDAEKTPLVASLGYCLPVLQIPRDSTLQVPERQQRQKSAWRRRFEQMVSERAPLLRKHTKNRQILERDELATQFERIKDDVLPEHRAIFRAFIEAPPSYNDAARALAELEWETDHVDQLFTGLKKKKVHLSEETLQFYEDKDPELLNSADREYLGLLRERNPKEPDDGDRRFYENHRSILTEKPSLKAKWDRFVFGASLECDDLIVGLMLAMERLKIQAQSWQGNKRLTIRWNARGRTQHLAVNADIATLFTLRYRGLPGLCGSKVHWELGPLLDYERFLETQKGKPGYQRNESTARTALRIRLDVILQIGVDPNAEEYAVQVDYVGHPNAVSANLPDDLSRLTANPFCTLSVARVRTSTKGVAQRLGLADAASFDASDDHDAGSFVPRLARLESFVPDWNAALDRAEHRIGTTEVAALRRFWEEFLTHYPSALKALQQSGVEDAVLLTQVRAYARLLAELERHSGDERLRRELLAPILSLGVVAITDGPPAGVVAPWHPFRIAATSLKARAISNLISHMLTHDDVDIGDEPLFFRDLREELAHPYYPEITVGYDGSEPCLLVITDSLDDYSLAEPPIDPKGLAPTHENPADGAKRVREVVGRYLELQPHESANLSVALFECDSAGLPVAAVNALTNLQESEIHCNVTLRHRDRRALQRVFSELLEKSDADPDALVASETSRNFMAKLRVGIQIEPPGRTTESDCRPVDIAFLQDVVSRRARVRWQRVPASTHNVSLEQHVPPRWTYKAPTTSESATRYLVCPEQPPEGWAYVSAVASLVDGQPNPSGYYRLPIRTISLNDNAIRQTFEDAHNLAEWVVNYDDLLDPEQLRHQSVHVIRYQKSRSNDRSIIVSSTARSRVLEVLVRRRIEELGTALSPEATTRLVRRLIDGAIGISGEIVLRASKRGIAAGELIGIVLSRALVGEELGQSATACFFLDDYAAWLGQKEDGIADLLCLAIDPHTPTKLRIIVTEAKYVSPAAASDARKTSRRQVEATVNRIRNALFESPGRLDRDHWLSRIADLLLDAVKSPREEQLFDALRRRVRSGDVEIDLRGYSHIFVSGGGEPRVADAQEPLPPSCGEHALQEVFSHTATRDLLRHLASGESLRSIREKLGPNTPWSDESFRRPAARPSWILGAVGAPASEEPLQPSSSESIELPVDGGTKPKRSPGVAAMPDERDVSGQTMEEPAQQPAETTRSLVLTHARTISDDKETAWLEETTRVLQRALVGWDLQAKVLGTRLTPNAGLVRLQGSDRLEAKHLEANRSRLLTTHKLNVLSVTPRPGELVVAIERPHRQIVSLWDVWSRAGDRATDHLNLSFVVGLRELDGEVLYLNLGESFGTQPGHAPHTLVAGTTGSGKSVLIQNLLLDIAATNHSDLAQMYVIDPKMGVDYAELRQLPHLREDIITDQERAGVVLESLLLEMDSRYQRFASCGARNLRDYNERSSPEHRLPALFVVHDEFAEWMLTDDYKEAVSKTTMRLGVKARAAGIYLFFAAQRPDKDVLPPQLRDNLGNRLILRVEGEGTSEIALGVKGAERLLGKGHCVARLQNESDVIYCQVPWIDPGDIARLVRAIQNENPRPLRSPKEELQ